MKDKPSFRERRHAQWNTPDDVLSDITVEAVKSPLITKTRIIEGEASEVYDIHTAKKDIILRISRERYSPFERELWALNQVKNLDVPVPTVILLTSRQHNQESLSICVEEKLSGIQLQKLLQNMEPALLKKHILRTGKILRNIHTVEVNGFGELDEHGQGESKSFFEYLMRGNTNHTMIKKISNKIPESADLIEKTNHILTSNKNFLSLDKAYLLHHDYTPKHILVDDDKITGVLDFAECRGGDPLQDIARWEYYYPDQQMFEWLKEGYADANFFDDTSKKKMLLYNLSLGFSLLIYYFWIKGYDMIPYHIEKLKHYTELWKTTYA